MSRLSIEITSKQHQRLKAVAALNGKSIKEYVLERALPSDSEMESLSELEGFLKPRIKAAEKGKISSRTVQQIFKDVRRK